TNTGGVPSTSMVGVGSPSPALPFLYTGGAYPGSGLTTPCGVTLAAGAAFQITHRLSPTTTASFDHYVHVKYFFGSAHTSTQPRNQSHVSSRRRPGLGRGYEI